MRVDLHAEMRAAFASMTNKDAAALIAAGVKANTLARMASGIVDTGDTMQTPLIGVARVRPIDGATYAPAQIDQPGGKAFLVGNVADSALVDIVAFNIAKPEAWRTRLDAAPALGCDAIEAAAWQGGTLELSATPLDWLRADRWGACILSPTRVIGALAGIESIHAPTEHLADTIAAALRQPVNLPTFFVGASRNAAAA